MNNRTQKILYVDDDLDDREILFDAIKELNPDAEVDFAENGLVALDYLKNLKESSATLPNLIVLDLNMPFLNGKETLQRIKSDEAIQSVPIVVFTSSQNPNDQALFKSLGIEFISKPDNIYYMNKIASHMLSICDCC